LGDINYLHWCGDLSSCIRYVTCCNRRNSNILSYKWNNSGILDSYNLGIGGIVVAYSLINFLRGSSVLGNRNYYRWGDSNISSINNLNWGGDRSSDRGYICSV